MCTNILNGFYTYANPQVTSPVYNQRLTSSFFLLKPTTGASQRLNVEARQGLSHPSRALNVTRPSSSLCSQMHLLRVLQSHLSLEPNLCLFLISRISTSVFTPCLFIKSDTHTHTYKTRVKSGSRECGHPKLSGLVGSYQQPTVCMIWCDCCYYSFLPLNNTRYYCVMFNDSLLNKLGFLNGTMI